MSRPTLILLLLALGPAAPSPALADTTPPRKGGRALDLRLAPEALQVQPPEPSRSVTSVPPVGAAVPPPETASRPGLAIELQPLRRRDDAGEGNGAASDPRERDALADRLERFGIEEFVIRFVRPL